MLVDGSLLEDDPARGGLDQIPHRHDERVNLPLFLVQDLLDILADPRRLDHVGEIGANDQLVFEAGVGLRVPSRPVPVSGKRRVKAELGQIADEKACSGATRPGDDEVRLGSLRCGLRLAILAPFRIQSPTNSRHV